MNNLYGAWIKYITKGGTNIGGTLKMEIGMCDSLLCIRNNGRSSNKKEIRLI